MEPELELHGSGRCYSTHAEDDTAFQQSLDQHYLDQHYNGLTLRVRLNVSPYPIEDIY